MWQTGEKQMKKLTKDDMLLGMAYLCRNGELLLWEPEDDGYYNHDLKSKNGYKGFDIIAVYGSAVWTREPEGE